MAHTHPYSLEYLNNSIYKANEHQQSEKYRNTEIAKTTII